VGQLAGAQWRPAADTLHDLRHATHLLSSGVKESGERALGPQQGRDHAFVIRSVKEVGLESYVERLMGGTKPKDIPAINPDMEQRNILTIIDKADKAFVKQGQGYLVKPHYEVLYEVAHPNVVGYQRFLKLANQIAGGWVE
jgi:hypothetical protein